MVREAFGGIITTDPCSNATSLVGAQITYTKHENGLVQPWWGHVFINPPYGKVILLWLAWGLILLRVGAARRLIYLIPARTDTRWFFGYVLQASSICFCSGRRKFVGAKDQAPFPVMFVHFGPETDRFEQAFAGQGEFWRPNRGVRLAAAARATTLRPMSEEKAPEGMDVEAVQGAIGMIVQAGLHTKIYESVKDMTISQVVLLAKKLLNNFGEGYFSSLVRESFGVDASPTDLATAMAAQQKAAGGRKKAAKKKAAKKKAGKKKAGKKKAAKKKAVPRPKKQAPKNDARRKNAKKKRAMTRSAKKKKVSKKAASAPVGGSKTAQLDEKVLKTLTALKILKAQRQK